jgi:FtsZ-binding cell division protein ZapB
MRELQIEIDNWKDKHNKTQDEVADLEVKFDQIETENARLRFQLQENEVWVAKFQGRDKKLDRFFGKNQHTPRKLLYFEKRLSVESSKIGHHFGKIDFESQIFALFCQLSTTSIN